MAGAHLWMTLSWTPVASAIAPSLFESLSTMTILQLVPELFGANNKLLWSSFVANMFSPVLMAVNRCF